MNGPKNRQRASQKFNTQQPAAKATVVMSNKVRQSLVRAAKRSYMQAVHEKSATLSVVVICFVNNKYADDNMHAACGRQQPSGPESGRFIG